MFLIRQVLVKGVFGAKTVPSGTVTSATNWKESQAGVGCVVACGAAGTVDGVTAGARVGISSLVMFQTLKLEKAVVPPDAIVKVGAVPLYKR